jgi:UDP-N-acetylglucosamine 2-epimerase (non-hydrolysing)
LAIRILTILGTRPEAIKLCPLVVALREQPSRFDVHVCSTGQHRELLEPVWAAFGVISDSTLDTMVAGQSLARSTARILASLAPVFETYRPDLAVVQGDTTTTLCGAVAAFYQQVPVAHVEAGLRSGDLTAPFPEEMHRSVVGRIATLHFASTVRAAENLRAEGVPPERIHVTGNTGIDALRMIAGALERGALTPSVVFPPPRQKRVVVTMHRREAQEAGLPAICETLNHLVDTLEVEIVFPVHPNPAVKKAVATRLRPHDRIHLCAPLDYVSFVALLASAHLVITDSGGIQEEAPYLGVPAVVVRETTERAEGVAAGFSRLVGFDTHALLEACCERINSPKMGGRFDLSHQTYGDGTACLRIRELIASFLSR